MTRFVAIVTCLLVAGVAARAHAQSGAPAPKKAAGGTHTNRLLNTTLSVRDLDAAVKFYVEGLGMHERGRNMPSKDVIEVSIGYSDEPMRAELMLVRNANASGQSPWGRVILEVADVKATVASVVRAGGKLIRPPGDVASAPVIVAMIEDPDGHQFELVQFK